MRVSEFAVDLLRAAAPAALGGRFRPALTASPLTTLLPPASPGNLRRCENRNGSHKHDAQKAEAKNYVDHEFAGADMAENSETR